MRAPFRLNTHQDSIQQKCRPASGGYRGGICRTICRIEPFGSNHRAPPRRLVALARCPDAQEIIFLISCELRAIFLDDEEKAKCGRIDFRV